MPSRGLFKEILWPYMKQKMTVLHNTDLYACRLSRSEVHTHPSFPWRSSTSLRLVPSFVRWSVNFCPQLICAAVEEFTMERKFFVGGNWKMNGSKGKIDEILKNLASNDLSPSTGLFHTTAVRANIYIVLLQKYLAVVMFFITSSQ